MRELTTLLMRSIGREVRSRGMTAPIEFEPLTTEDRLVILEREASRTRRTLEVAGGLLAFFFVLALLGRR